MKTKEEIINTMIDCHFIEDSENDKKNVSDLLDEYVLQFHPNLSEIIREVEGIITLGCYEADLTKDEAIAILRKHQQPDRLPSGAEKCGQETCNHNIKKLPYLAWIAWAEDLDKKGIRQTQCPVCKFWLFQEEI
jgi:hypothetical protein